MEGQEAGGGGIQAALGAGRWPWEATTTPITRLIRLRRRGLGPFKVTAWSGPPGVSCCSGQA